MLLLITLALIIGVAIALQVGVNAQLGAALGDPVVAALVSFAIGTLGLAAYTLLTRPSFQPVTEIARIPLWQMTGGLLGALYVAVAVVLAPRLGAGTLVAVVVTGQLIASLVLDHFGLIGFPRRPAELTRVIGVVLLRGGMYLIQKR